MARRLCVGVDDISVYWQHDISDKSDNNNSNDSNSNNKDNNLMIGSASRGAAAHVNGRMSES